MGQQHDAAVDEAIRAMPESRRKRIGEAAGALVDELGMTRKELVDAIARAQGGSAFIPEFEAVLDAICAHARQAPANVGGDSEYVSTGDDDGDDGDDAD